MVRALAEELTESYLALTRYAHAQPFLRLASYAPACWDLFHRCRGRVLGGAYQNACPMLKKNAPAFSPGLRSNFNP